MTPRATSRLTQETGRLVAEIREVAADCRARLPRLFARYARYRRDSARLRRVPRGEASIDSGLVAAWCVGVLLSLGAVLLAGIAAAAVAWVLP